MELSPSFEVMLHTPKPKEFPVTFEVSDFDTKPWLRDFEWLVVVNRANTGADKQSIRIYHNQIPVTYEDVSLYLAQLTSDEYYAQVEDPSQGERDFRVRELATKQWAPGVFKVSTGRNQFEDKGQHHSQHASWTITPTGMFYPQSFEKKHKSESYSNKMCDSFIGHLISAVTRKTLCTYMENATFFNGPIALHKAIPGTEGALGEKASGGCVRLPAALAEYLFHVLADAKGRVVPLVHMDGSVDLGRSAPSATRSALIIVQDQVK